MSEAIDHANYRDLTLPYRERSRARPVNVVGVITGFLVIIVFTQKLAIPLGSSNRTQVAFALVLEYLMFIYLLAKGAALISPKRLVYFAVIAGLAVMMNIGRTFDDYSPTALLLFLVILFMYVFAIPLEFDQYKKLMRNFIFLGFVVGCFVWVDWITQIAHMGMPNLENVIPKLFLYREYNYLKKMFWGALQIQPNGIFFLESSHLSQFLAMALVAEIALFQRLRFMFFLGLTLLASFGGTGLLICVVSAPFLIFRVKPVIMVGGLAMLPVVFVLALQLNVVDNIARRSGEIGTKNASATIRFVLPFQASADAATGPVDKFLFGKGPGMMPKGLSAVASFAWAPWAKLLVEYGFIIFVPWVIFLCMCLFPKGIPIAICVAGFTQFMFLNGSLGVPLNTIYCLFLSGSYLIVRNESQSELAEAPLQPLAE
jgi:hypothetical protein